MPKKNPNDPSAPNLSARNPRALAECVLGRPIDWSAIADPAAYVEEVLQTPYEQLFDPKYDSPIYMGFELDDRGSVIPSEFRAPQAPEVETKNDAELPELGIDARKLSELTPLLGDISELAVRAIAPGRAGGWMLELGPGPEIAQQIRDRIFDRSVIERLWDKGLIDRGWTPDGEEWTENGTFFNNAAEFSDPVQGALGDCWLIAAMSSVAWAMPTRIADRQRATNTPNDQYKHRLIFTDPNNNSAEKTFEVTNHTLAYQGTHAQPYARSSDDGEVWPGIVEKAFAQWRQNTTNDRPNLTVLNGGDPVWASAALSGRQPTYVGHAGQTAASLKTFVKSHCQSYRTVDPMTAWTYGTAPEGLSYSDANIVGNHAYTVLGWTSASVIRWTLDRKLETLGTVERERLLAKPAIASLLARFPLSRDFVVLRNPWGYFEGTAGALHATIALHDVDFWRNITLSDVDGVFAIDFDTYQAYFAGTGVAL